jgi:hypothetical protein
MPSGPTVLDRMRRGTHPARLAPPHATPYARPPLRHRAHPPLWYWSIPCVVAALRMLPLVSLRVSPPPAGQSALGVSYLPKDFLQYAALSRQVVADGAFLFYDPFTTEPQAGRLVFLFHWLVGLAARLTGLSALEALEWSRVPLLFGFFAALWWFLGALLPERKDRLAAALLVGFAGGLESFVRPFAPAWLPPSLARRLLQDTSPLHGWSVFASGYNPLWIAALTLALLVLRPLLFSGARSARTLVACGAGLVALFFVHPYTALGVSACVLAAPASALLLRERLDLPRLLGHAAVLAAAGGVIGAISLWQLQDPIYRASVGGVFGSQSLSPLWYPLTLGALGLLAGVGARRWSVARHPGRAALFGWLAAIAALHALPFLNGYKFVFLLPLPLCILAAPVAREWLGRARGAGPRALVLGAAVALFGGALLQSADALRTAKSVGSVPADLMRLVETLAALPPGHVLAPSGVGNVVPAFTSHRVWVGHWFLTPDFFVREQRYQRLVSDRALTPELLALLREQRIRYFVVPARRAGVISRALGEDVLERRPHGELELLILR